MYKYFIIAAAAVMSAVIASPLPDFTSQEQQQWGDETTTPFLLSPQSNDQLLASNPSQITQTGFEANNVVVPSMPFAMDIHQIVVGGGEPSVLSNDVLNPSTSFDVATTNLFSPTILSTDPGLSLTFSSESPGSDTNTGTEPAAGSTSGSPPGSSAPSSSPPATAAPDSEIPLVPELSVPASFSSPPVAAPGSEVPALGSTQEQAQPDLNSIFEPPIMDEDKRYAAFECGASASVCCQLGLGSQATATPKALSCSNSKHPSPFLPYLSCMRSTFINHLPPTPQKTKTTAQDSRINKIITVMRRHITTIALNFGSISM